MRRAVARIVVAVAGAAGLIAVTAAPAAAGVVLNHAEPAPE